MRSAALTVHGWSLHAARALFALAATIAGLMCLMISFSVISRYVFNEPIQLVFELAEYGLLWMIMGALPILTAEGGHIQVELGSVLGGRMFRATEALVNALAVAFALLLFVGSLIYIGWTIETDARMPSAFRPPRSVVFSILVISSGLMLVERVSASLAGIATKREPEVRSLDDDAELV